MRRAIIIAALGALLLLSGCGVGIIYTHTYQPLTLDQHRTPVSAATAEGNIKHIQFGWFGVAWDSDAIGDIAKKNGIIEVYSADLETLKILTVWNQYTVHIYGR
jgi:hypothetical protein